MTKTIWKYVIKKSPGIDAVFDMPLLCEPLRVAMQGSYVCFWACVVPVEGEPTQARLFRYTGTGDPVPMKATYIGSCTDAPFEWHVWEITE